MSCKECARHLLRIPGGRLVVFEQMAKRAATGLQSGKAVGPNNLSFGVGPWVAHLNKYLLAQSLAKVTPLLFAGLSVTGTLALILAARALVRRRAHRPRL